jgi:primosomal protein N''
MGAPEGRRNGRYRHGRYSRVIQAERKAAAEAERERRIAENIVEQQARDARARAEYARVIRDIEDWKARNQR